MKNAARLLFICLLFAAGDARAQFQNHEMMLLAGDNAAVLAADPALRSDFFQYMARPFRDRTERLHSARVETLQMDLAVDDESGRLTLENWGDNRADIRPGAPMLKVAAGGLSGTTYNSAGIKDKEYSGEAGGAYVRFWTFEAEASQLRQEAAGSASPGEDKKSGAGAAISLGGEGARLGLHANTNTAKRASSGLELPNTSAGAALAFRSGIVDVGFTADYVNRGMKAAAGALEIKRSGPLLGVQTMIKPHKSVTGALRASVSNLSGDRTSGGGKSNVTSANVELGTRLEWKPEGTPLTLAMGYEKLDYIQGNKGKKAESQHRLKTLAASFRFFDGRFLLGAQVEELTLSYDVYNNNVFSGTHDDNSCVTMAGGAEVWLLPWFAVRGSVKRMDFQDDLTKVETFYNSVAAGAGLKVQNLSLDVTARKIMGDSEVTKQDEFSGVKAALAYKF
ncbi:MAG: hypothetical protein Q7R35_17385 [Elusimicrobiota bacterium]|nr:hypothetical protein [Elusimicrobiota bacterium]